MNTRIAIPRALDLSAIRGAVLIVLGIVAIAFPVAASITTSYVVAWVLAVAGFTHLLFALQTDHNGSRVWTGFVGFAYVLAGGTMLANPLWGVASIAMVLGVVLMVEGVLSVLVYFIVERTSRWVLVNGLITMALAAVIASGWMSRSLWMIGTLAGVNLVIRGVSSLATWIEGDERLSHLRAS
jgi:uncharacterized membrane protein HdeD (DUF308 family)